MRGAADRRRRSRGYADPGNARRLPYAARSASVGRLAVARQAQPPRRAHPSQRRRGERTARADRRGRRGFIGTGMIANAPTNGAAANPLREGLAAVDRIQDPCTIVFFGASGDLFKRMLLPAIYSMRLNGTLPADFALIGFSRTAYTDDAFRKYCFDQLMQFSPADQKPSGGLWDDFAKRISYITADFNDTKHFVQLKEKLAQNDADLKTGGNHLFYLSTPPPVFPEIVKHLKNAKLDPAN